MSYSHLNNYGEEQAEKCSREALTKYFLPAFLEDRVESENVDGIHAELDHYTKKILGVQELTRIPCRHAHMVNNEYSRTMMKRQEFYTICLRYSRIFDLCRILGISHLYDIGCRTINQSFLLTQHTKLSYTGISDDGFDLNDFMPSDIEAKIHTILTVNTPPPPLCAGRIRFVSGHYPDVELEIPENNIAIACYSFTFCSTESEIQRMAKAVTRDFERVLFNIKVPAMMEHWMEQDWTGYELVSIGPQGFLLATRNPEDIRRMKAVYEWENGEFDTGIDSAVCDFADL